MQSTPSPGSVIHDPDAIARIAHAAERVAVLGMRSAAVADRPAHYVPARLQQLGVTIVPVPTREPEVSTMLGEPVVRDLSAVGPVDIVCVFRRSEDVPAHVDDLLAIRPPPKTVWLQSGIRSDEAAARLTAAGIDVVQSRCLMVERQRPLRS